MTSDRYTNEADCVEFATLAARQQLGTVEGAIAQGRITIDDARTDACLEAFARPQTCAADSLAQPEFVPLSPLPNVAELLASCPDMLVGHVANNRACNLSEECRPDPAASAARAPGNPVPGAGSTERDGDRHTRASACPTSKAGERCNQSSDCEPRFTCRTPEYTCGLRPQLGGAVRPWSSTC